MKKELIVHIGSHKTGTTTLQRTLHWNAGQFLDDGYAFGYTEGVAHVHNHLGFDPAVGMVPNGFMMRDLDGLVALLRDLPGERAFISSENFSFVFSQEEIARLGEALKEEFETVRILVYLRRQDSHLVSHHQEGAKPRRPAEVMLFGTDPAALPPWTPAFDLYLDYNARLRMWAEVFGAENILVRLFERDGMVDNDIVSDFLDMLEIDYAPYKRLGETNTSEGFIRTKCGHLLNRHMKDHELVTYLFNNLPDVGRSLPSRAAAMEFYDRYRDSNRELNEAFSVSSRECVFDEDFSKYPEEPGDEWTDELAGQAIESLIVSVTRLMSSMNANVLRDAGQALAKTKPQLAKNLLNAALLVRPEGGAIRAALKSLKPEE